ncbi:aldehyde dehydrogenase family protein [Prolixibacter sp. SD074]|uniref:aldehyde dehydrogenase family protein n=1 Tax=Prolixibacter sp. SD074 TaxID=2652391 RepID=UPI00127E319E|nr:aldehyde dehydrogenase family protein [Prolixibacter sp. SD074]GET28692.1 aldehyde dehydrogenase [Prolixibacter sp. SD074]
METSTQDGNFVQKVRNIFDAQKAHQHVIKQTSAEQRIEKLKRFREGVLKYAEEVGEALYADFQRPPVVSYAIEVGTLLNHIDYTVAHAAEWLQREPIVAAYQPPTGFTTEIVYEPKGVVLIVGPWNVPFFLTLYPLISAIAAGDTAIIKPSELTPNHSALLSKLIADCFDENEVTVIEGGVAETTELLKLPFDHIYFTGSPKVAKIVMKAAAENLTSVTLELGGKAPAIIHESADLDKAVPRIIKAKALNAGQICMDTDYVLIPKSMENAFIEKTNTYLKDAYYTKGDFNYDDYDQIINVPNFNRLKRLFDDAVANSAKVEVGGVFDEQLRRIQPTVLTNVSLDSAIMKEEIFGPLLPIITYDTQEEIVDIIRAIEKPLALYVFSNDNEFTDYIISHTTSGGVTVNDVMTHAFDPAMPFGGVNQSGIGKGYGKYGFLEMTNARAVVYQSPELPNDEFFKPPYEGKAETILGSLK